MYESSAKLVVIGLGYVGLPLAIEAIQVGMRVHGLDRDIVRIEELGSGRSYIDDVSDEQLTAALSRGFIPTDDPHCLETADVIIICVPTPLREGVPDLSAINAAAEAVAARFRHGALVILESTTYPGTTNEVLRPMLEREGRKVGQDFYLAFSPERIDPGNRRYNLKNTPKIVGGLTPECGQAAERFYLGIVHEVVRVSSAAAAEMTKLLENTYRQVNIALVNEMAIFCHELNIDLWEVIEAASTKPFGFHAFYPGPGVGGHCIPIDPNYLSHRVRGLGYPFRFVELAQEINARMPGFVVDRIGLLLNEQRQSVRGANVLLLGVTYKADVADQRESPSRTVAERLLILGANVTYHDPYVAEWDVGGRRIKCTESLDNELCVVDLVVLLQAHACYNLREIADQANLFLDTRGKATGTNVVRL